MKITHQILDFIGFYLVVIGTWRLANATKKKPVGNFIQAITNEESYKPYKDLYSPHKVIVWLIKTVREFRTDGQMTDAVILQKKFNWGLLWLLLGVVIQYIAGLF